ncbi:MAG: hypothetical protein AB1782_18755 [Cyanobacteriota bacterium]
MNKFKKNVILIIIIIAANVTNSNILFSENIYKFATLRHDCAPWDSRSIVLNLAPGGKNCDDITLPVMSFNFWRNLPAPFKQKGKSVKVYKLSNDNDNGSATICYASNNCKRAINATITFTEFSHSGKTSGKYEVQFKDETLKGTFKTDKWCDYKDICG